MYRIDEGGPMNKTVGASDSLELELATSIPQENDWSFMRVYTWFNFIDMGLIRPKVSVNVESIACTVLPSLQ
jgi:hypothetical protein